MGRLVFFDTMLLIWSLRKNATTPEQRYFIDRTRWLIERLEGEECRFAISSVTLSEYLRGVPDASRHGEESKAIREGYAVFDFTVHAAEIAPGLVERGEPATPDRTRLIIKADAQIVATAKTANASEFYTFDDGCAKLARKAGLRVGEFPSHTDDLGENAGLERISKTAPKRSKTDSSKRKKSARK